MKQEQAYLLMEEMGIYYYGNGKFKCDRCNYRMPNQIRKS